MAATFFFYDLETTGFNARSERIMQFAGQRTDMNLKSIGKPLNYLIKLTPDVLPSPDAILVTGITPQQTLADGITEAEFLKIFHQEAVQPDTVFVGFNNVRFDDEFMCFLQYRNFYDAYEWRWKNGCSRWDLLDMVRMMRALRPDGIEWPFAPDGKPANRLEFLAQVNKLGHEKAHDALSDVEVTVALARLVKEKQPDLFGYLLDTRDKRKAEALITKGEPFAYTTGRYPGEFLHTSAAIYLAGHPQPGQGFVYDLRFDPTPFLELDIDQLIERWQFTRDPDAPPRLPVKTVKYNRCPAVAPLGVIKDAKSQERIGLTLETIARHKAILDKNKKPFIEKLLKAKAKLDASREADQAGLIDDQLTVDARLHDGFIEGADKALLPGVRGAKPEDLDGFRDKFRDERLKNLLPLYKARNYPSSLNAEERTEWDAFCKQRLFTGGENSRLAQYFKRLEELAAGSVSAEQQYILEELQLYGQSIVPSDADGSEAG